MYYITLDLEWNQAYYQKAMAVQKRLGARLRGEVIQIGAVKLNERLQPCGSCSIIVKPRFFGKIHRHVSRLTGITQDRMDHGMTLPAAAARFREFCGEDFAFLTWGPDDIPMLRENFHVHDLDAGWLERAYDMQPMFNRQTDGENRQRSLEYAMQYFGIEQTLPAHDALNDAYFTALVAQRLDIAAGIRAIEAEAEHSMAPLVLGDADAGEDGYVDLGELLGCPEITAPACPCCGGKLTADGKMVHLRGQKYRRLYECETDGTLLLELRVYRNFNETWRGRRTFRAPTEEETAALRARLEEMQKSGTGRRRRRRRSGGARSTAPQQPAAAQDTAAVCTEPETNEAPPVTV